MSALGRAGGKARRGGLGKQLPPKERESLREYLRDNVDNAEVWGALKAALESGSQTAVVSAARLLVTELYEPQHLEERDLRAKIAAEQKALAASAGEKILRLIESRSDAIVRAVIAEFERQLEDDELAADARRRLTEVLADVLAQLDWAGRIPVERKRASEGERVGREPVQQFQRPA